MKKVRRNDGTPAENRAHLVALGVTAATAKSSISRLLAAVEKEGIPATYSRATQYRARKATCAENTPYGRLVEIIDLPVVQPAAITKPVPKTIGVQNPFAMLHKCYNEKEHFRNLMQKTLREKPTPWRIILYSDGITPADGLTHHDQRSEYAIYLPFAEFGEDVLCHEEIWFVLANVRTLLLDNLPFHLAHLMGILLDTFFFNPEGNDFETSGLILGEWILTATVGIILADLPAFKEFLGVKGHSGLKPCHMCGGIFLS